MMTRIWLVRHAESADPTVFHGAESDIELSKLGEQQALAAAAWFRELRPTRVISSAQRRAVATAKPIAETAGVPHLFEPDFHERRIGKLCGVKFSLTDGPWASTLAAWTAGHSAFTTEGAESFDDLRARLLPAWERVTGQHRGERIVLVAHGVVCKVLLLSLLDGWGPVRWNELGRVENLATSELIRHSDGPWQAEQLLVVPPAVRALHQPAGSPSAAPKSEG
ncbi:histidine phosphatase family protein [Limnoglobus roseus]|uniref:Histidine phosphatase family protein n=1 Tax=Limnoglobus roseus TaxID=2598579 RepID=A0A5C1ANH8_9BACT|nr:histidine phosphatase family protein [Limnoglobus roseus]QEL19673.1 histidine phosphatase family protein [Limnoglobus roseus]